MTDQNPPTFDHILNQATSQETWKTYFCAHNINKDIPSGCTVFKGLVMPKACAKIIQYSCSLKPQKNAQPPITGEVTNTKYIDIDKFFGKNKESYIKWLDHSAAKHHASPIPHVMNASLNILDNNSPLVKKADLFPPLIDLESAKRNELVCNICSLLPLDFKLELAPKSLFPATKFKPGPVFDLVDINLSKSNVNFSSNLLLPIKSVSSQSLVDDNDANHLESTSSDIDSSLKAGNTLCLVLGSLVASPSVVLLDSPPDAPVSVGKPIPAKAMPRNEESS
ncbi:hypothetical protein DSO57_1003046 [Entomophthora muscae]|uniref:Uncharacterized protein n=1 Tax=Entomophthora muscae TaxID=34485 RepID=A0ACC2TJC1_9FUNG|nr:hypothetical protein DSO57_1003046 [Entomophthora muscae]